MKVLIICHKNVNSDMPRGGEKSVGSIANYLKLKGHSVTLTTAVPQVSAITKYDVVTSWGKVAYQAFRGSQSAGVPFVLMVRFWRNVAPRPAGRLMERPIDMSFRAIMKPMYKYASAVITNTRWAAKAIARWHFEARGKIHVSYVPVLGQFKQSGKKDGVLLIVTPEIYGEYRLVEWISQNTQERCLVINCDHWQKIKFNTLPGVTALGYMDMEKVWANTKALLVPIYNNDICGTKRVTIEAFRHGVPALVQLGCGAEEKVSYNMRVAANAPFETWGKEIAKLTAEHQEYQHLARKSWETYGTADHLAQVENIFLNTIYKNQTT